MILTVYSLYTRERCNSDTNEKKKITQINKAQRGAIL